MISPSRCMVTCRPESTKPSQSGTTKGSVQPKFTFCQIKGQLVVFRDRLEGPKIYKCPVHVAFQVLGPGNQVCTSAASVPSNSTTGRQKFTRHDNPQKHNVETAATNRIMSGTLPAHRMKDRSAPELEAAEEQKLRDLKCLQITATRVSPSHVRSSCSIPSLYYRQLIYASMTS